MLTTPMEWEGRREGGREGVRGKEGGSEREGRRVTGREGVRGKEGEKKAKGGRKE